MQLPRIASGSRVFTPFTVSVIPGPAQTIRFGIQQGVQRLFHRTANHVIQMDLNLLLVDLNNVR
jgi:hypothetical protein